MSTDEGKNQGHKYTCPQGGRAAPRPLGTAGRTCARCTARVRTRTAYRCTSHTTYMRTHHIYIANMYHNTHMTQLTAHTRVHELSFGGVHGCCGRPQSLRCCRQRLEGCQGRGHSRPPQEQAGVGGHRLPGSLPGGHPCSARIGCHEPLDRTSLHAGHLVGPVAFLLPPQHTGAAGGSERSYWLWRLGLLGLLRVAGGEREVWLAQWRLGSGSRRDGRGWRHLQAGPVVTVGAKGQDPRFGVGC